MWCLLVACSLGAVKAFIAIIGVIDKDAQAMKPLVLVSGPNSCSVDPARSDKKSYYPPHYTPCSFFQMTRGTSGRRTMHPGRRALLLLLGLTLVVWWHRGSRPLEREGVGDDLDAYYTSAPIIEASQLRERG